MQQPIAPEMLKCAEGLRKAMKGMGTDEKALIQILCRAAPGQGPHIAAAFQAQYCKDLMKEIEDETSGDFQKLLVRLCGEQCEADCRDLNEALHPEKDGAPDKDAIIEILSNRTNYEINVIKAMYQKKFGIPVQDAVQNALKSDFKQMMHVLLAANRDEANVNCDIMADVEAFYKAGVGKFGTDEDEFIALLCNRGADHLRNVFKAYESKHKMSMDKVIKKEFSGSIESALLTMVRMIEDRPNAIARQFEDAMSGLGTNEKKLMRLAVRYRDPATLQSVKAAYQKKYGKSLVKRVEGETSGDFKKALVAVLESC